MRTEADIKADFLKAQHTNDAAWLRRLATEISELGLDRSHAWSEHTIGVACSVESNFDEALEHFRIALAEYETSGSKISIANTLSQIGNAYLYLNDFQQALEYYTKARNTSAEANDQRSVVGYTQNIGIAYGHLANYPKALECFQYSLSVLEQMGDREMKGFVLSSIGIIYIHINELQRALTNFEQALQIHVEFGNVAYQLRVLSNMGDTYSAMGEQSTAIEYFQRALAIAVDLNEKQGEARITGRIVFSLLELGDFDGAVSLLEQQAGMDLQAADIRAEHLMHLSMIEIHKGDLEGARTHLLEALELSQKRKSPQLEAMIHKKLKTLSQKRNDFAEYIKHNDEHARIMEEIQGKEATQKIAILEAEKRMESELRERDKERALLHGALPKAIADRMLRGEKVSGDHHANSCVLFLDIVNFTTMSDTMPPEKVVSMLGEVFAVMDSVAGTHGVTKIKTIGDSYMAVTF